MLATTFYQLFLSYCTSFYGAEIWYEKDRFKKDFKDICVLSCSFKENFRF